MRRPINLIVSAAVVLLLPLHSATADPIGGTAAEAISATPNSTYGPAEVVTLQMQALGSNDDPFKNAGIEITFRFASPTNKRMTGPLDRFALLFDSPAYAPMLNHQMLEVGPEDIRGGRAVVPVFIETEDSTRLSYLFVLSRQAAESTECGGCWMTDSVYPLIATNPDQTGV
jgi:hypothetical protein